MQLVNHTPIPCTLSISKMERSHYRLGFLTAKATYAASGRGAIELDTQSPFPVFSTDVETELGLLPSDAVPRRDPAFEVIVLGEAHGHGRTSQVVELAVGERRRQLLVFGDRHWKKGAGSPTVSPPLPFQTLPLRWDRAFGGSTECLLDSESVMDLEHPMNKYGRGFNAEKLARDLGQAFKAPAGFPRLPPDYLRTLPNLEDPAFPIRDWADEPRPCCWATVPADIGASMQPGYDHFQATGTALAEEQMLEMVYHRAHPDWIIPRPQAGAQVELKGMTSDGTWSFPLPRLRVRADYQLGERTGTRDLEPHLLMLLPAERRFYLVYRHFFTMEVTSGMARSFRLRMEEGWIP